MERAVAGLLEVFGELLDARLVGHRRIPERARARGFCWVLPRFPVHQVELLGLGIVGLEIRIGDRPRRGDAAIVPDLLEVALAQPEQDRPKELRVATHEVLLVRLERLTVLVVPDLAREVAVLSEDLAAVPVLRLARKVAAALQQEDALARRREAMGQCAAARAGADDDDVVELACHETSSQTRATGDVQAPVAPRSFG